MNEKAVIREIKKSRTETLIWQRKGEFHYISNGHWAIKIKKLPSSILGVLVSIFGQIPQKGRSLRSFRRDAVTGDGPKVDAVYKKQAKKHLVLNSPLSAIVGEAANKVNILSWEKGIIYINSNYCAMVGKGEYTYYTDGDLQPVICAGELCEFLLLPIRRTNRNIQEVIKSLSERIGA